MRPSQGPAPLVFVLATCHVRNTDSGEDKQLTRHGATRLAMLALGWALLLPGLIFVVLPPPFAFGIFMVLPGIAILVAYSKTMRRLVQRVRARHTTVDVALGAVETRVPGWIGRTLKRTRTRALVDAVRRKRNAKVESDLSWPT